MGDYSATYRGVVVDNADPEQQGRLRVEVPDVAPGVDTWAVPEHHGAEPLPVGSDVWIRYEMGNPDYPIWSG